MAVTAERPRSKNPTGLRVFLDVLKHIQKLDAEFPLHYTLALTHIALDEGMSLTTLAERMGISLSTASRIVGALSNFRPNGQPYNMIDIRVAVDERRRKELFLTPKGKSFLQRIGKMLEN
jgi:DNA-binding MarR family transcriptional regulator